MRLLAAQGACTSRDHGRKRSCHEHPRPAGLDREAPPRSNLQSVVRRPACRIVTILRRTTITWEVDAVQITEGLFSRMVLQRSKSGASRAMFAGTCKATGNVEARVRAKGKTLRGWNWKKVGQARRGKLAGRINGLASGGPYDIDLRIVSKGETLDTLSIGDVLVGDVWVLAGQSNMEGIGWLKDKLRPISQVRAFYMTDVWDVAADPLHTLWCAVDPVHGGNPKASPVQPGRYAGVGPGVSFGQDLYKKTGVPQGLLCCGHGGTSMTQWDPAKKKEGGKSLYGAMCRRVKKNGGSVAGVFWYQGCSDADPAASACYMQRMKTFVQSMRRDFKDPRLPVVTVQISRVTQRGDGQWWDAIREQQRRLPEQIKHLATVPAIDLPLSDGIHLSGSGQAALGKRAAEAMQVLREGKKAGSPPIDVRDITVKPNPISKQADVIVRFSNVAGSLTSAGRPTGFYVDSHTNMTNHYRVDLGGDKAILHLGCTVEMVDGNLYYGRGFDPYCNVTDQAGRSIPAFGPLLMKAAQPRAITPFVNRTRISKVLAGVDIRKLGYPTGVKFETRQFPTTFCDRHLELGKAGEALVYYAFDFRCTTPMKLNLLLGYDGPVKVWMDRKAIFCDPKGTNPARPEDAAVPFVAKAGEHEILVALGSHGAAWGVYLRLERTDVSKATLRKNPQSVVQPEVLG